MQSCEDKHLVIMYSSTRDESGFLTILLYIPLSGLLIPVRGLVIFKTAGKSLESNVKVSFETVGF